ECSFHFCYFWSHYLVAFGAGKEFCCSVFWKVLLFLLFQFSNLLEISHVFSNSHRSFFLFLVGSVQYRKNFFSISPSYFFENGTNVALNSKDFSSKDFGCGATTVLSLFSFPFLSFIALPSDCVGNAFAYSSFVSHLFNADSLAFMLFSFLSSKRL